MTGNGLAPIHPREFLSETLAGLGIARAEVARAIGVSAMTRRT